MNKVLWFTPAVYPLDGGQQLYTIGNVKALADYCEIKIVTKRDITKAIDEQLIKALGIDVTFVAPYDKVSWNTKFDRPLSKYFALQCGTMPVYKRILNCLIETVEEFKPSIIVIDYIGLYNYYKILKRKYPNIKYIYHSLNAEYLNFAEIRKPTNHLQKFLNPIWIKRRTEYEHEMIRDCYSTTCISRNDIQILSQKFQDHGKMVFAKPLIKFERVKSLDSVAHFNKKLMIIGSMDWYPNVNGIIWFIENVFQKLLERDSEYKLYLVGKNPTAKLKSFIEKYSNNVILTGFVESTNPYFEECDISIIPVFEGTGAKIKVLESIGKCIPTICSDFAAKDYDINDEMIVVKEDANEYFNAIIKLESDVEYRCQLVEKMLEYKSSYYQINGEVLDLFTE